MNGLFDPLTNSDTKQASPKNLIDWSFLENVFNQILRKCMQASFILENNWKLLMLAEHSFSELEPLYHNETLFSGDFK